MGPRYREKPRLKNSCSPILHPEAQDHARVEILRAVHRVGHPRTDNVIGEKWRNCQPKDDLGRFPPRHATRSTAVDKPEAEKPVREQGAKECGFAYRVAPQCEEPEPCLFHRVERNKAEGMVGEVCE